MTPRKTLWPFLLHTYCPLLGTLGASLLENLLTSKSTITAGEGTIRASRSF